MSFVGKKESASDQIDWIRFELTSQNNKNVQIMLKTESIIDNKISMSLYDSNNLLIKNADPEKQNNLLQINIGNLVSGWYFIKIDTKIPVSKKRFNYQVHFNTI